MRFLQRWSGAILLAAAVAIMPTAQALAQSNMQVQPAAVISIASIDEQSEDVRHIMAAAGLDVFGEMAVNMSKEFTEHFQTSSPIGAYISLDSGEPQVIGFVPVTDLEKALSMFEAELGEVEKLGGDMMLLTTPDGQEAFIKEDGGFAFFSNMESNLSDVPADPAGMLAGLEEEYNFALRFYAQNIPAQMKDMAVGFIEEGMEDALDQVAQADPAMAEFQREMNEVTMSSLIEMIDQTDEVTIGIAIDEETQSTYLDFSITAVPGSQLAEQVAQSSAISTNFAGFLHDDAAASMHFASKMADEDVAMVDEMFGEMKQQFMTQLDNEGGLDPMQREVAERVFSDIMDVMSATLQGGVLDGGGSVVLNGDTIAVASGMTVVDGTKIEDTVKELVAIAESEGADNVTFMMDDEEYSGVTMHRIEIEIPAFEEDMRDLFGDNITIVLGTSDDAIYFAAGKNCLALLKSCMDGSANGEVSGLPNSQFNLSVARIMNFAAEVEPNEVTVVLADTLDGAENDRISITSTTIENGARTRIEIQDDIIKLLGVAGMQFGPGLGGPGF